MNPTSRSGAGQSALDGGLIRFTHGRTCPVCGCSESNRRGQGQRCHGYISGDWIHCTREEHASGCDFHSGSGTYSHRAKGACPCGKEHGPALYNPERPKKRELDRVYQYKDLAGNIVHETVRYKNPKHFNQRRPNGKGRYIWKEVFEGIKPILYKLSELCAADLSQLAFIVEGEKDVERLMEYGLVATTNPMGAKKWHMVDATPLNGRPCVVIVDNDDDGRIQAQQVAAERHGKALSVKLLELPGLPEKGDVSDWLDQGGTPEQLLALAAAAPAWSPDATPGHVPSTNDDGRKILLEDGSLNYSVLTAAELNVIDLEDVKERPTDWLWKYRLVAGEMALLAGEGGLGKSQIMLWIASAISNGSPWPDGAGDAPLGQVIIMTAEDSAETTIKPRLIAMGANMSMIKLIPAPKVIIKGPNKDRFFGFKSLCDHGYWERVFELFPNTKLLIVDPVVSYLGKGVNDQKNDEVRAAIEPFLERVIRPRGICFFANTHLNKTLEAKSVQHRITGSIAYVNLPRNVHCVLRDSENPEMRIFGQCKTNNAPLDLKSLEFTIAKHVIASDLGEIETSMPVFSKDLVEVNMTRVIDGHKGNKGPKPMKSIDDAKWLVEQLKDGPVHFGTLKADALVAGILTKPSKEGEDVSMSPLYNAKRRVKSVSPGWEIGDMKLDGRVVWELVKSDGAQEGGKPAF
jgi:hypothetical protein